MTTETTRSTSSRKAGEWKFEGDILLDLDSPPRHEGSGHGGGFDD
jgi:hypothetical protein